MKAVSAMVAGQSLLMLLYRIEIQPARLGGQPVRLLMLLYRIEIEEASIKNETVPPINATI